MTFKSQTMIIIIVVTNVS